MNPSFDKLYKDAVKLLHSLITPEGILASSIEADNYKRVWARDSIVSGLAGLWSDDPLLIQGLEHSLITLSTYQHETGMIPSNVLPEKDDVSFGSLVGRIDATTWFILGACMFFQKTQKQSTWETLLPAIVRGRHYLNACEFNGKGWIYTPLSGNWADEYPVHGYTLYDNVLRLWGEALYLELTEGTSDDLHALLKKTRDNFWPNRKGNHLIYQQIPFESTLQKRMKHFVAFILPGLYDTRFDAAGNALAMMLFKLTEEEKKAMASYIKLLQVDLGASLIPAFWPIMDEHSEDWYLMKGNHSFSFKNTPGNFHNGGIWPVWMGLFCLGLKNQGLRTLAEELITAFTLMVDRQKDWAFNEFFQANTLQVSGKTQMAYTASGIVFMKLALDSHD